MSRGEIHLMGRFSSWRCPRCTRCWSSERQRCGCRPDPGAEPALHRTPRQNGVELCFLEVCSRGLA